MHLINRMMQYLLSLVFALDIFGEASAINVFYRCRDNPIQYSSQLDFNCSNPNEVIYVLSAVIGFTPLYKADNNVLECPINSDTCTKTSPVPSTLCNGYIRCSLAQRILLYNESGIQCNINVSSGNLGGNYININYSCISTELCSPLAGYNGRFICSTSTVAISVSTLLPSSSFSTAENFTASTNFIHLNTNGTDGSFGTGNSSDSPSAVPSTAQTTQLSPEALPSKDSRLGLIIGTSIAAVVLIFLITILLIFICIRRQWLKDIRQEPETPLTHRTLDQDSLRLYSSSRAITNNIAPSHSRTPVATPRHSRTPIDTPSHSSTPIVNAVQTASFAYEDQYARIHKSGDDNVPRQRSIYELAGAVTNYDVVRSTFKPVNQTSIANEDSTNVKTQRIVTIPMFQIEGDRNGNALYGIVRKSQNMNNIKSNEDADTETEKAQSRVISMFPPTARNVGRTGYQNCTEDVTKQAKAARNTLESKGHSLSDIVEEVDWEQDNEVELVDNALYSG